MDFTITEEEAVRQFASATLGLLKTFRSADHSRLVAEIRRVTKEAHEADVANMQAQQTAKPLLLTARQVAKSLSISPGTLYHLTAPRGPIPVVRIGTRTCYAVADLEAAIEQLKVKPAKQS
jgi:hypothetical protein